MSESNDRNTFDTSREHLANERTFLAWVRTSIALMGFGFVIVKFSLFLNEISLLLDARGISAKGYSAVVGLIMVAVGVVIALLAFLQYRIYTKQLSNKTYISTTRLSLFITLILLTGGILLIIYLGSIVPR